MKPEGKESLLLLTSEQIESYKAVEKDDPAYLSAQAALDLDPLRRGMGEVKGSKFDLPEPTWDTKAKVAVLVNRIRKADDFWRDAAPDELLHLQVKCSLDALPPVVVEGWEGELDGEVKEALAAECHHRIFIEPQLSEAMADFLTEKPAS